MDCFRATSPLTTASRPSLSAVWGASPARFHGTFGGGASSAASILTVWSGFVSGRSLWKTSLRPPLVPEALVVLPATSRMPASLSVRR